MNKSAIPTIQEIHKRFCEHNQVKYNPDNLISDLKWKCFAVATVLERMLKEKGIKGARAVYGMWEGRCVEKRQTGHYRHGWVVIDKKTIIDPTRWVFDSVKPQVYKGSVAKNKEYDEGAVKFRASTYNRPFPKFDKNQNVKEFHWSQEVKDLFKTLTNQDGTKMSMSQILWCCNLPFSTYGDELINEVYTEFEKSGFTSFIPFDYKSYWKSL